MGGQLTAKANTRSTVEWKVLPSSSGILFPTLWSEELGVWAVKVGPSVHGIDTVCDEITLLDVYWRSLVRTASHGKGRVLVCDTEVQGHGRLQAKGCMLLVTGMHDRGLLNGRQATYSRSRHSAGTECPSTWLA